MVCLTYVDGVAATSAAVQLKHVRERNLTFFHFSFFFLAHIHIYIYVSARLSVKRGRARSPTLR